MAFAPTSFSIRTKGPRAQLQSAKDMGFSKGKESVTNTPVPPPTPAAVPAAARAGALAGAKKAKEDIAAVKQGAKAAKRMVGINSLSRVNMTSKLRGK